MQTLIENTKKHKQDARWTLSPDIYNRITERFKDNKIKFSRQDFIDLATKYDKPISAVTRILNHLEEKNKIVSVGEMQTSGGGWKFKIYQVVSGANLTDKYEPDYRARIADVEKHNTECALRLQNALNMISMNRYRI